jgi:hypothetical protein
MDKVGGGEKERETSPVLHTGNGSKDSQSHFLKTKTRGKHDGTCLKFLHLEG